MLALFYGRTGVTGGIHNRAMAGWPAVLAACVDWRLSVSSFLSFFWRGRGGGGGIFGLFYI